VAGGRPAPRGRLDAAARAVSLIAAAATAIVLTAVPFLAVRELNGTTHAIVSLVMLGMSAGFVHGLGMRPRSGFWRVAFSPWTAWPLMALGWIALLAHA